ncbi:DgyrCDS9452 [Dimorphilus gyrociliatus]|uniref:DgyrCDS9452 n=1 Tax=Dimorphilus gyrociliatus TaxID=2664684 RepID=A0A7I8VX16_9ANNE|nr:DgyrCDS9452 [Dimorphilus gyrociliatus]
MSIRNCLVISVPVCAVIVALIWFRRKKFKEKNNSNKDKAIMSNSEEKKLTDSEKPLKEGVKPEDIDSKHTFNTSENQKSTNDSNPTNKGGLIRNRNLEYETYSDDEQTDDEHLDEKNESGEYEKLKWPAVRPQSEIESGSDDSPKLRTSSRSSWAEEVEKFESIDNKKSCVQELSTFPETVAESEEVLENEADNATPTSDTEKESQTPSISDKDGTVKNIAQVQNEHSDDPLDASHVKVYRKNTTSSEFISPMKQKTKIKKSKRVNFQLQRNSTSTNKKVTENEQHLNEAKAPKKHKKVILKTKGTTESKSEETSTLSNEACASKENKHEPCSSNDEAECSNDSGNGASGSDGEFIIRIGGNNDVDDGTEPVRRHTINFPSELVGLLIGRSGKNVDSIIARTGVQLSMKPKVFDKDHQLCILKGSPPAVERALNILKKRFREVDLSDIDQTQDGPIYNWGDLHLNLTEGKHDVVVSSVYSPCELFIQLSRHPSYCDFRRLIECMKFVYTDANTTIPQLPRPVRPNIVCAAPLNNGWYRAIVRKYYPEEDECEVKYVDYGGYQRVSCFTLRQLRIDFLSLPFQAVKCRLAGLKINSGAPDDVVQRVESMLHAQKMVASVRGYANDEPLVDLYIPVGDTVFLFFYLKHYLVACLNFQFKSSIYTSIEKK